ncbi:MAG: helix-turn-helix transcriptional regulator [Clostridiales bacterium]|nr:helix-turn-helix transcriptional regulator [Clostridiales bacterium]
MSADFARVLTLLRREKGYTQRKVAAMLEVSQALLSHYENGVREPGFEFLCRAAEFYSVTTDYLLGRTMSRDGKTVETTAEATFTDTADEARRTIINGITVISDLAARSNKKEVCEAVNTYLTLSIYKLFRFLYIMSPKEYESLFSVPTYAFSELTDVQLKRCELILRQLAHEGCEMPDLSYEELASNYPELYTSLMELLHNANEQLGKSKNNP